MGRNGSFISLANFDGHGDVLRTSPILKVVDDAQMEDLNGALDDRHKRQGVDPAAVRALGALRFDGRHDQKGVWILNVKFSRADHERVVHQTALRKKVHRSAKPLHQVILLRTGDMELLMKRFFFTVIVSNPFFSPAATTAPQMNVPDTFVHLRRFLKVHSSFIYCLGI